LHGAAPVILGVDHRTIQYGARTGTTGNAGVIDSGYRGELFVGVTNLKKYAGEKTVVRKGDDWRN